jgi:hypothetical protein
MTAIADFQRAICQKYKARFVECDVQLKLGINRTFDAHDFPINGLRHSPRGDTCGWYIWSGEQFSEAPDFFVPLHVIHLVERCPEIVKYLGLAPGWRFLHAPDHEDVWFDGSLLEH